MRRKDKRSKTEEQTMKENHYPELYKQLTSLMGELGKEIPETMQAFGQLHAKATAEGTLSTKVKELISLAIAVTCRCDGCIAFHAHGALEAKASKQEVAEAIGVAILMGGGPSVMYGVQALEAVKQFEA
jgi:AhpD family alkylhydroperoxidase